MNPVILSQHLFAGRSTGHSGCHRFTNYKKGKKNGAQRTIGGLDEVGHPRPAEEGSYEETTGDQAPEGASTTFRRGKGATPQAVRGVEPERGPEPPGQTQEGRDSPVDSQPPRQDSKCLYRPETSPGALRVGGGPFPGGGGRAGQGEPLLLDPRAVHESRDVTLRMRGEGLPSLPRVTVFLTRPRTPQILPRQDRTRSVKLGDIASPRGSRSLQGVSCP